MSRFRSRVFALAAAGLVLVLLVAAAGWSFLQDKIDTITATAQFDSAAGLYEGNTVAVLGMPVGKVTTITCTAGKGTIGYKLAGAALTFTVDPSFTKNNAAGQRDDLVTTMKKNIDMYHRADNRIDMRSVKVD